MLSQKRKATESLLPIRAAKQPRRLPAKRRNRSRHSKNAPEDGIMARWSSLAQDFWVLGRDTISKLTNVDSSKEPDLDESTEDGTQQSDSPSTTLEPLPPSCLPSRRRTQSLALRAPSSQSLQTSTSNTTDNIFLPSNSSVTTPPSTHIRTPSESTNYFPEIQSAISTASRRINGAQRSKLGTREHIYADKHKARVHTERKKDREQMAAELYAIRKRTGYSSDFGTFQHYLSYKARLEMLERRNALQASPSLTDLRSRTPTAPNNRRHSMSEDVNSAFLERALKRARETLNEPKPPKPFSPAIDLLSITTRLRDAEIEKRIRPKSLPESLSHDDDAFVSSLLRKRGIIAKCAQEQVQDSDLYKLNPGQWLNDEIINFYGALILVRSEAAKRDKENTPLKGKGPASRVRPLDVHYFSTFFYTKLEVGYEKSRLARWTKKFDIFAKDVILIPINHNNAHWTAAAINFRQQRIEAYDSMSMHNAKVFKMLRSYLNDEHQNKKKTPFDFNGWVNYSPEDTPQQENMYDCGVFTCQFLESIARGEEGFNFSQKNMSYLRRCMIWEIGSVKLRERL